jgi:hypothetical protein
MHIAPTTGPHYDIELYMIHIEQGRKNLPAVISCATEKPMAITTLKSIVIVSLQKRYSQQAYLLYNKKSLLLVNTAGIREKKKEKVPIQSKRISSKSSIFGENLSPSPATFEEKKKQKTKNKKNNKRKGEKWVIIAYQLTSPYLLLTLCRLSTISIYPSIFILTFHLVEKQLNNIYPFFREEPNYYTTRQKKKKKRKRKKVKEKEKEKKKSNPFY